MKRRLVRRAGFAGQHLVVLPEPLQVRARRHPLLHGLQVTDAGYFPAAKRHRVERPAGAPTTLVILCLRGAGWVRMGSETRQVTAGDFAWLSAHEPHAYGSGAGDPWTIAWAHFAGDEVDAWRSLFGVPGPARSFVKALPDDRLGEIALDQVYAALERGFALRNQVAAAAAMRQALSTAAELAHLPGAERSAHERVVGSIATLRRDWARAHRLAELAAAAGVSVTHYSALFRRETGFAPIDYLIRQRVQHACRLLDSTDLTVGEIAARTGYEDPYYFTRCFRRVMGRSPRAYRQVPKG